MTGAGVTVLIPLKNGGASIRQTLDSVAGQSVAPVEIIVVDDWSNDGSRAIVKDFAIERPVTIVRGPGRGAAAALNAGLERVRTPLVCQIDQDVVLHSDWISKVLRPFENSDIAAVQGMYVTDEHAPFLARVMARDLEDRYTRVPDETDHVCTGNAAYRLVALQAVGGFDERLGYGYDNDISYRLRSAGFRLIFCRTATATHHWRHGLRGYFRQQYGFGYGRLDVVAKHRSRLAGDAVSPALMMIHPLLLTIAMACCGLGFTAMTGAGLWWIFSISLVAGLLAERAFAGVRAARRFKDLSPLSFPFVHLLRDFAWVLAIAVWAVRRALGVRGESIHSMRPRTEGTAPRRPDRSFATDRHVLTARERTLVVIPAFNEALNLQSVVEEIQTFHRSMSILVVDDGSTDDTAGVVQALGVRWVRLPERMGIGAAMRVALRYAVRHGYSTVVRLDGDGQHRASDISPLLQPIFSGTADVVFGSRRTSASQNATLTSIAKNVLSACLTMITRHQVGDPTCGLCAVGSRAIHLLAEHHPAGYPEAELRLLLSRTSLVSTEILVEGRRRLNGTTSLTPLRLAHAAARIALAMCVVPFRRLETEPAGD